MQRNIATEHTADFHFSNCSPKRCILVIPFIRGCSFAWSIQIVIFTSYFKVFCTSPNNILQLYRFSYFSLKFLSLLPMAAANGFFYYKFPTILLIFTIQKFYDFVKFTIKRYTTVYHLMSIFNNNLMFFKKCSVYSWFLFNIVSCDKYQWLRAIISPGIGQISAIRTINAMEVHYTVSSM